MGYHKSGQLRDIACVFSTRRTSGPVKVLKEYKISEAACLGLGSVLMECIPLDRTGLCFKKSGVSEIHLLFPLRIPQRELEALNNIVCTGFGKVVSRCRQMLDEGLRKG